MFKSILLYKKNNNKPIYIRRYDGNSINITRNALAFNPLELYNPVGTMNVVSGGYATNIINNADFSSGITGWSGFNSSISASNNIVSCTASTGDSDVRQVTTIPSASGKKVYVRVVAKVTSPVATGIHLRTYGTGGGEVSVVSIPNPIQDTFYTLSGVVTVTALSGNLAMRVAHTYVDNPTGNGKVMQVKEVMYIDLTALYGAGTEPDVNWCNANIPFFTGTKQIASAVVKHGKRAGVFGDTDTVEYDFYTKVANSTVECPLKMFGVASATIGTPPNSFSEFGNQTYYDNVKVQDGTLFTYSNYTNGNIIQILVEVDLTPLANALGGNSALKSALKSIQADVWAMGSGANGGVNTNGVVVKKWDGTTYYDIGTNTTGSISKISYLTSTVVYAQGMVLNSNKIYILIASQYASDGTIPSSVNLDYLKVTVQLNRVPDVVSPISTNLPKYWAMVVKGFSPCFDNANTLDRRIISIYKDDATFYDLLISANQFRTLITMGNMLPSSLQTFNKNQVYNFIFGISPTNNFLYLLKNNGTVEKITNPNITIPSGMTNLKIMSMRSTNLQQANAFLDNVTLIDLEKANKVKFGQELVVNGNFSQGGINWNISDGIWDFSTGNATLTVSNGLQWRGIITSNITALSSSKYIINIGTNTGTVAVQQYDSSNNKLADAQIIVNNTGSFIFTTVSNCSYFKVQLSNGAVGNGTFTFDNISLKQVLQDGFTDDEAQSILDGSDKYYVATTSDFVGKISGSVVENPNISKRVALPTLQAPNGTWNERDTAGYTNLSTLNGVNDILSNNTNTNIAQHLFSFDIISILERKYGTLPCPQDLPSKIAWAKANIKDITVKWYGYGLANGVNKAYISAYTGSWRGALRTITASIPTLDPLTLTFNGDWNNGIQADGYYNFIAYTDPVTAGNTATIYTDYISLDVTAKIMSVNPYMPSPELFDINTVTLHANASRNNGVITLNANGTFQSSTVDIPVLPNNQYEFKGIINESVSYGYINIKQYYNNIMITNNFDFRAGQGNKIITTGNNVNKIKLTFGNSNIGTFTFSQISLKRKD